MCTEAFSALLLGCVMLYYLPQQCDAKKIRRSQLLYIARSVLRRVSGKWQVTYN